MEPFTRHTDQPYEHRDITPTEEQLLAMALANIGEYIHQHGTPDYILIDQLDPRNEEDYDSWEVGMEPIPGDQTWKSKAIDVSFIDIND